MKRWFGAAAGLVLGGWGGAGLALAEQRFPPPEFEQPRPIPAPNTPPPRALSLEYLDVAVLVLALALACYLVLKKRSRKGVIALSLFSVAYFGFYRKGCICPIGSVQNLALALADPAYAVPIGVLAFFVAPLAVALFAGRMFCAGVCPHGALQDLVLWKPVKVPSWLEQGLALLPYVFLGAGVMFAACGSAFIVCRYDPFVPLFRLSGRLSMVLLGAGLLVLGMFIGRPYCRFLCPYGALLRLAASVSKWRARVTPDFCTQCRLCEEACPYGALREPSVGSAEPPTLASDRRRLGWLLLLLPALLLVGGWVGSQISVAASKANATVALAERFADPQETRVAPNPPTPESLSLARAEQDPKTLLAQAISIRKRFATGGWLFGGWLGLVAALKLISLSVRRKRTDYEPDRGACLGCARCFLSCPNERVRLGLLPPEVIGRLGAPGPVAPGKEA